ncbi:uncharacterized protein EDB93DRAFT_1185549 [Suillus bovinus]|uniref:uncharacterized protein n=1 Tax=Suillus bovinus TaxID=48563 RepID=UPI001B8769D7|nr:uncharacterized protein EDB93DRAFT_1185549 [Suillus bovinus]KAG2127930.1 hypothetical protein EDB93DRAFT_1185549 [Suillus bovinus]
MRFLIRDLSNRSDSLVDPGRLRTHSSIAHCTFTHLGAAIFLVRDAAYTHSPAGGQGMNMVMRDAIFHAQAMTKHVQASAGISILVIGICGRASCARLEVIGFTKPLLKYTSLMYV